MKKKTPAQWSVITNQNPILSAPRGQLKLVVDNTKEGVILENITPDLSDSVHLWTNTPVKSILKTIKSSKHPSALYAIQKLTVGHSNRLEIMMALFEARSKIYKKGA